VVIIAHELGHFFTAKAVGARVEEFGIGFPPRLFGIKWGDTLYSVNAIPFGGFNRLTGEVDPSAPGSLASKSKAARVLVLGGGILVNLILPVLFFSISYMVPHDEIQEPVVVKSVVPDTPAAQAGIRAGDTILSIDGKPLENLTDLLRTVQLNLGKEITLGVSHSDGTTATVKVIPRWKPPPNQGALGIELDIETATAHSVVLRRSYPFWEAIPRGITSLWQTLVLYKDGIISLFVGTAPLTLAGPVGIVQMTGEVARAGFAPLMEFASFISIALAITQILPLPALDGGHIAFVVLEWIRRGKRVSPKVEGMVHTIGFILLLALMLAITYQDIARIISGKSLLQ
jgi:regulator of sigma E protease